MRKLASIRRIDKIENVVGADFLACAYIGGWTSVVKKGQFEENELVIYIEIDAWVPIHLAPFLQKGKKWTSVPAYCYFQNSKK